MEQFQVDNPPEIARLLGTDKKYMEVKTTFPVSLDFLTLFFVAYGQESFLVYFFRFMKMIISILFTNIYRDYEKKTALGILLQLS